MKLSRSEEPGVVLWRIDRGWVDVVADANCERPCLMPCAKVEWRTAHATIRLYRCLPIDVAR